MNLLKSTLVSAAMFAAVGAHATLVTTLGGDTISSTFLSASNTDGSTLSGSYELLTAGTPVDVEPGGAVGGFLSVEGTQDATLTFGTPTSYVSFEWGSPDSYNTLVVTETNGTVTTLHASNFGLATGAYAPESYVQIMDTTSTIKSLTYYNSPTTNSFETANYSITPVPEPETYALMLGGLGVMGFVARRRRG